MKKINNVVRGLLVVVLAFASIAFVPSSAFAADNENVPLSGVDARAIITNGGTSYVSNFNGTNVLSGIVPAPFTSTSLVGDGAYGLSFVNNHLFVAAGKRDSASISGGLQVLGTSAIYGTDTYTYNKVFAVSDALVFVALFDGLYAPKLEAVSYNGTTTIAPISPTSSVALTPATSAADITALSVSGNYAYVGIQDSSNGGYVNVVNISNPSAMSVAGTYLTPDAVTSIAVNGTTLYVGHGSSVDVVNVTTPASPTLVSTISTGDSVKGLTTDGTYLYVANGNGLNGNGLRVYNLAGSSLIGRYNTAKSATAVSVSGSYIYVATSDGSNSQIFKIKNLVITLNGANPQTVQLGSGAYVDPGATASDGSTIVAISTVNTAAVGSYTVIYTANDTLGVPGLQVIRTVNVTDTAKPIITLNQPAINPQTVKLGASCYTELGATTNDGSLVQINSSAVNCLVAGSYTVTYDATDGSGNKAVQKTRTVNVAAVTYNITASAGANGSISPTGIVVVADGGSQSFTITPTLGYIMTDLLVDTVSVGPAYNYTFNNVTAPHTIVANFVAGSSYTITASTSGNGSITPSGAVLVNSGGSQSFTITANSAYRVSSVLVDVTSVGAVTSYAFTNVTGNHTIVADFTNSSTGGGGGGPIGGGGGGTTSGFWEIPGCALRTTGFSTVSGISCVNNIPHNEGVVLGADKFIFTLLLKQTTPPPYPRGAAYVNEVMELQKFLNAAGFNSNPVDGKFGPITKGAVIRFQLANGLKGDGVVGPLTRAVLNK